MKKTNTPNKRSNQELTSAISAVNIKSYLQNDAFTADSEAYAKSGQIKSGYSNLDSETCLYPGLYVLGAISSLGKTTFIHQMADQLVHASHHVLYFSIEQTRLELTSKSLARFMAQSMSQSKTAPKALTALDIRLQKDKDRISEACKAYSEFISPGRLTICECGFNVTIEEIVDYVKAYIKTTGVTPIIIIDYLQVIQSSDPRLSTKDAVDTHVRMLKQLQSDYGLIMIVISSFNRANYLSPIDYESFKESGGIEYTCDVLWGLQLQVLHDEVFNSQKVTEKRKKIAKAKAATPRKIELVCLKNRFGRSSYTCNFDYFPQFDYFKATETLPFPE